MAHTFGTGNTFQTSTSNPQTFSFTTNSGDTVLCLMIVVGSATLRTGGAPTFNGVAMIQAGTTRQEVSSPETSVECWYLLAPPIGAFTVSIPNSGSLSLNSVCGTGRSGSGVSFLDNSGGAIGTSTNPTSSIATTVNGDIIFGVVGDGANITNPVAVEGTAIDAADFGLFLGAAQYILQASAGTQNVSWTQPNSDDWAIALAAFSESSPSAGGTGSASNLLLMGVG